MRERESSGIHHHPVCPFCGERKVGHIRRSGIAYRMRRRLTSDRLYRCHSCHKDFWVSAQGELREVPDHEELPREETARDQGPALSSRAYYLVMLFSFVVSFILMVIFGKK